jgi:hypothetical protein
VLFGGAVGVGRAVGPVEAAVPAAHEGMAGAADDEHSSAGTHEGMGDEAADGSAASLPKGLMVSQDGYTFRLADATLAPGRQVPVEFTIEGPDGRPVTAYDVEHDKRLHLIAVRRDFSGFQHVHPVMDEDGTWRSELDLRAGPWRVFADFKPTAGEALTLGTDVAVPGSYQPARPAEDSRTSSVRDYTVTLDGDLTVGEEAELVLRVSRDGRPVTDLEPYLAAYGHLVALRDGDLAYLHVHPEGAPDDGTTKPGPDIVFFTEVPSPGRYHLFLDFKHQGAVRTAAFTVTVHGSASESSGSGATDGHSDGDGH